MTIRVDGVWHRPKGGFGWEIKGYEERGIYVQLDTFFILQDASRALAVQFLETALVDLGWGSAMRERTLRHFR